MSILFSFPKNMNLAKKIAFNLLIPLGEMPLRQFPDGESYVRLLSDVHGKQVIIVCSLDAPNQKIAELLFFASVAKELGAQSVGIVAPYLGYMRQDKRFTSGEAVTSKIFAEIISQYFDWLITVDPHLHRYEFLNEIYSIPCTVVHTVDLIRQWIHDTVKDPLIIGPDKESEQWAFAVAKKLEAPSIALKKIRRGDRDVDISVPNVDQYLEYTPVLVDDIISTGRTMIETLKKLYDVGFRTSVCVGIHGLFVDSAYEELLNAGVTQVATTNTVLHKTNTIDVSLLLASEIKKYL